MPSAISGSENPKKRKRSTLKDAGAESKISALESQIQESQRHYNNIPTLLALANEEVFKSSNGKTSTFPAVASLGRVFFRLQVDGRLRTKAGASSEDELVVNWLKKNYAEYQKCLLTLLKNVRSETLALRELMQLVNAEVTSAGTATDAAWRSGSFAKVIDNLLGLGEERSDSDNTDGAFDSSAVLSFAEDYAQKFDDVRHATFTLIADRLNKAKINNTQAPTAVSASLTLLMALPVPTTHADFCPPSNPTTNKHRLAHHSSTTHKNRAQTAYLALFTHPLTKPQQKTLLHHTTHHIAPWFSAKPEHLMDFLTDSFNVGGSTSLLALSGLFHLMQQRNLDYPMFFTKLYSLLDADLLHSKHRSRFFRLLNTFMASTHLPAALVASFIKRLARLALAAPPAAVVAVVPWTYNMLMAHPACTFMLHRTVRTEEEAEVLEREGMDDPFDMHEDDPMQTNALESSLWELECLRRHYHPNVASLAGILGEQFTKRGYSLEDFLDHSYGSLIEAELGKDLKKTPVVEFKIPKRIFTQPHEKEPGVLGGLLGELLEVV